MRVLSVILTFMLLSGCGIINEVNQTLDYGGKVSDYISTMTGYQNELSDYLSKNELTAEDLEYLKSKMEEIRIEVQAFNDIESPNIAEGVHQQIVEQNNQILTAIDEAERQIQSGQFNPQAFEQLEIVQTMKKLKDFQQQVENVLQ